MQVDAIVVDWGTTSLRATLVGSGGRAMAEIETDQGVSTLKQGEHEAVLMSALEPWFARHGALPVAALGMITSRNGWVEVPYVPCPAGPSELAAGAVRRDLPNGSALILLAGLTDPAGNPYPDVMRGEETQVLGHGLDKDGIVILPGTHSKWARIVDGRIGNFQTFITGEVFQLLMNHSFVARGAAQPPVEDPAAFHRGLIAAKDNGSMLGLLFSARTGVLANKLTPGELRSYVSGMVIGHEFRQAADAGWFGQGDRAAIVGNDGLNEAYAVAAGVFGLTVHEGVGDEIIRGALTILNHSKASA